MRPIFPRAIRAVCLSVPLFLLAAGCGEKPETNAFGLKTARLQVGSEAIIAEVADTPEKEATGLMFRDSLPEDHGMIFELKPPRQAQFWMHNTRIPLSIAFIDQTGKIMEIRSMKPFDETNIQSRSDEVAFALEANEGWFARHRVKPGTVVIGLPRT